MNRSPIVAYLRVSTAQQGKSGLGLEAQREAVARFAQAHGHVVVDEHVEVETGKGFDALDRRPKLKAALAEAKRLAVKSGLPVELVGQPYLSSDRRIRSELGWAPRPVVETLADTIAWIKEREL
jgi:nucleoside-diphosphate-sugar epimerase